MKERSHFPAVISASPWLIYTHGNGNKSKKFQTLCTVNPDDQPLVKIIPSLRSMCIIGSSHGWLILRSHVNNRIFHLWNPFTSNLIQLPPLKPHKFTPNIKIYSCILTNNPDNINNHPCIVLLFCKSIVLSYRLSRGNSNNWVYQGRLELEGKQVTIIDAIVDANNGVIYGLAFNFRSPEVLVTINVDDENSLTLGNMHLPFPDIDNSFFPIHDRSFCSLIETCGVVYLIGTFSLSCNISESHTRLRVVKLWKLEFEPLKWVEVHSIGDRAFFFDSEKGSNWCWADNGGGVEPNSVYVYDAQDNVVYLYRLSDHSLTPFCPCPGLMEPWDHPAWIIMPHHHQRSSKVECGKLHPQVQEEEESDAIHLDFSEKPFEMPGDDRISLQPEDVILHISKYLHLFDYLSFSRVCKSLGSQLPLPKYRTHNQLPLLLFSKNMGGSCQLMDPCRTDSCSITIPLPSYFDKFVDFSNNGWLLFDMRGQSLKYYNMFTGVAGVYPTFDRMHMLYSLGFSTFPTSSDCLTLGILGWRGDVVIAYHFYGEDSWKTTYFDDYDLNFQPWISSPIFVDGAVYVLDKSGHLGVISQLEEEEPEMEFYNKPELKSKTFYSSHLVECDGQILSVFVGDIGKWIQVFKFNNLAEKKWVELTELRNNILFINHSTSFSVAAPKDMIHCGFFYPSSFNIINLSSKNISQCHRLLFIRNGQVSYF